MRSGSYPGLCAVTPAFIVTQLRCCIYKRYSRITHAFVVTLVVVVDWCSLVLFDYVWFCCSWFYVVILDTLPDCCWIVGDSHVCYVIVYTMWYIYICHVSGREGETDRTYCVIYYYCSPPALAHTLPSMPALQHHAAYAFSPAAAAHLPAAGLSRTALLPLHRCTPATARAPFAPPLHTYRILFYYYTRGAPRRCLPHAHCTRTCTLHYARRYTVPTTCLCVAAPARALRVSRCHRTHAAAPTTAPCAGAATACLPRLLHLHTLLCACLCALPLRKKKKKWNNIYMKTDADVYPQATTALNLHVVVSRYKRCTHS